MAYIVNPKQTANIKDGDRVYKPGEIFPRKITALLASGLLVEMTEEPKEAKKKSEKGESGQKSGASDTEKKG